MSKSPDAFRTISEVAEWLDTPAHVLRFWESKFSQVKPVKRAGGRRYYRPSDMLLLGGIKQLLHNDGMTIKGAQKVLSDKGVKAVSALSQPLEGEKEPAPLKDAGDTPARIDTTPEVEEAPFAEMSQPEPNVVPFQRTEVAAEKVVPDAEDTTPSGEDSLQPDLFGDMFAEPVNAASDDDVEVVEDDQPETTVPASVAADSTETSEPPAFGILSIAARVSKLTPVEASQIAPFVQELQSKLQHDNSSASV